MLDIETAIARLLQFGSEGGLTTAIAALEADLAGATKTTSRHIASDHRVDLELLDSAVSVRRAFGRVSDVIHAAAIVTLLPLILREGERIVAAPSLAAGNSPDRPYDLETNLRVCEFKLAEWKGSDAMRKRQTFKDLVQLAREPSDRTPELFVVGQEPIHFLRTCTSKASWGLDRHKKLSSIFEAEFGSLDTPIHKFWDGPGARVVVTDLTEFLPSLDSHLVG